MNQADKYWLWVHIGCWARYYISHIKGIYGQGFKRTDLTGSLKEYYIKARWRLRNNFDTYQSLIHDEHKILTEIEKSIFHIKNMMQHKINGTLSESQNKQIALIAERESKKKMFKKCVQDLKIK